MSTPDVLDPPKRPLLAQTWAEMRRRKVVRVGIAYVVVAWVVLQVGEVMLPPLGAPAWVMTWSVLAAILGLPVALVLAWYFDASPSGIAREPGARTGAARLFVVGVTLIAVAGVGWWLAQVYEPREDARAAGDAPPNSIAVLPFDDLSEGRDQGWLADGIAEELLDRLARIEGLRVAARTSSFAFRERADDVREIGRALDVALVLEGSVRKAGGRIRVTAQLIDAADGYHVWSQTYERGDADIFALQDEVTAAIAQQLEQRIGALGEVDSSARPGGGAGSAKALELYLEARQQWRRRTPVALERARELFAQSLEADPDFVRANAGLADTYLLKADYGLLTPEEAVGLAEPYAVKAVTLDPRSAEAWATIGLLRMTVGQLGAARRSFEQAIALDPRYEMAPMWLAGVHGREGRFDQQEAVLRQALALNPLEPVINANLAQGLAEVGKHDEAVAVLERVLAVTPEDDLLLRSLAEVEARSGRLDRALAAIERAYAHDPNAPQNIAEYGDVLASLEAFEESRKVFAKLPPESRIAARARQIIAIASGERTIDPGLTAMAEQLAGDAEASADNRETLTAAGLARLVFGDARGSVPILLAASGGSPEALSQEPSTLEPASLLVIAYRRIGEPENAQPWHEALDAAAQRWFAVAGTGARVELARAMIASMSGDRAAGVEALEAAYAAGFRERWRLRMDPRLEAVRDDPKVRALDARIGEELARIRAK